MGNEYAIRFKHSESEADSLVAFLRRLPEIQEVAGDAMEFELRATENDGPMPNASIRVQADGLYFCDYGGGREFLGLVMEELANRFGRVIMQPWE